MKDEALVHTLVQLGLSEYEAKAYIALLRIGRASAYAVAKAAGIPTSKVYQAIQKLVRRLIAIKLVNEKGRVVHYRAVPIQRFLEGLATRHNRLLTNATQLLTPLAGSQSDELIWSLDGWDDIRMKALSVIHEAKAYILVSGWPNELTQIDDALLAARKRKCRIAMVHYAEPSHHRPFPVYIHRQVEQVQEERAGHFFCLSADGARILFAHIPVESLPTGAYSTNTAFAGVTDDFIRHDIYFLKVMRRFGPLLAATFGNDLPLLRDPFTDNERPTLKGRSGKSR